MHYSFNKRFNMVHRVISAFIGFAFLLILCYFIMLGVIAYKAVDVVQSEDWGNGIKPVLEKLWCGKPGCLN